MSKLLNSLFIQFLEVDSVEAVADDRCVAGNVLSRSRSCVQFFASCFACLAFPPDGYNIHKKVYFVNTVLMKYSKYFLCITSSLDNIIFLVYFFIDGSNAIRREIFQMFAEKIRIALIKRGNMSEAELARRLNISPQNLNNKMKRDDFKESDLVSIAAALDCTFHAGFTLNDTKEEI